MLVKAKPLIGMLSLVILPLMLTLILTTTGYLSWFPTTESHTLRVLRDRDATRVTEAEAKAFVEFLGKCTCEKLHYAIYIDGKVTVDAAGTEALRPGGVCTDPTTGKAQPYYPSLSALKNAIIASGKTVILNLVDSNPNHPSTVDAWEPPAGGKIQGVVDIADINALPADVPVDSPADADAKANFLAPAGSYIDSNGDGVPDTPRAAPYRPANPPPWATTRCQALGHILGERYSGVTGKALDFTKADLLGGALAGAGDLFSEAHQQGGMAVERQMRRDRVAQGATLAADPGAISEPVNHDAPEDRRITRTQYRASSAQPVGAPPAGAVVGTEEWTNEGNGITRPTAYR